MKVSNVKVYDLEESIIASGYPMRTDTDAKEINEKDNFNILCFAFANGIGDSKRCKRRYKNNDKQQRTLH